MFFSLRLLTAGESHGPALTGIIEGIPAGLSINTEMINRQLARRQMGYGRGRRMQIEQDQAEILSGVRHGITLGSPIALKILNRDWENWQQKMSIGIPENPIFQVTIPRPGHADLAGIQKYGFQDIRNVLERASARETTIRVALGAICRQLLHQLDIQVASRIVSIHQVCDEDPIQEDLSLTEINDLADASPVRCINSQATAGMMKAIDTATESGDTLGGVFEILASGLPVGLGSYTHFDRKLNTRLSAAVMSINGIKGVEIGAGFAAATQSGGQVMDEIFAEGGTITRSSNNAGGIEGGMSNGELLRMRAAMKPIPTLRKSLQSVDLTTLKPHSAHKERSDVCAAPAAAVIAEHMVCIVLADAVLEKYSGDSMKELLAHFDMDRQTNFPRK